MEKRGESGRSPTVVEHREGTPRRHLARERHFVGDHHHRHATSCELAQHLQHVTDHLGIQRAGGLVLTNWLMYDRIIVRMACGRITLRMVGR